MEWRSQDYTTSCAFEGAGLWVLELPTTSKMMIPEYTNASGFGGAGNDKLCGRDETMGVDERNNIWGGADNDEIYGAQAVDSCYGELGNDTIYGGNAGDILSGGAGNDMVFGQDGTDDIYGGIGDDELHGGAGQDTLSGGDGDDLIAGGAGDDYLYGDMANGPVDVSNPNDPNRTDEDGDDEFIYDAWDMVESMWGWARHLTNTTNVFGAASGIYAEYVGCSVWTD